MHPNPNMSLRLPGTHPAPICGAVCFMGDSKLRTNGLLVRFFSFGVAHHENPLFSGDDRVAVGRVLRRSAAPSIGQDRYTAFAAWRKIRFMGNQGNEL